MDLTTTYLGLPLKNPLVASASPLTRDIDNIRRLEDAGAAAVVLPSIFEEQIRHEEDETERLVGKGSDSNPETMSYFAATAHHPGPQTYLDRVQQARQAVDIPVIASLNGITDSGWTEYARLFQEAGASALELNVFFVPSDLSLERRRGGASPHRYPACGEACGDDTRRRQTGAIFQRRGSLGASAG